MHYIKVLNKFQSSLSVNDKIKIFIDILNSQSLRSSKSTQLTALEKKFVETIFKTVFNQKKYQLRLAKILNNSFSAFNQASRENKYFFLLQMLMKHNVKVNFNHYAKKPNVIATTLFHIINKTNHSNKTKLDLYKKLFSYISKQVNVSELYYYKNSSSEKIPFLNYFLNHNGSYNEFIYYICLNHKSFGFEIKDSLFLKSIITHNKENFEDFKVELINSLPIDYIKNSSPKAYQEGGWNYCAKELILYYCKEKTIKKLLEKNPKIFDIDENSLVNNQISSAVILENYYLTLNFKLTLLEKFSIKRLPVISIYLAILNEEKMNIEKANNFINYCLNHFETFKENNQFENLNHLLCCFRQWQNPLILKNIILKEKLPHIMNKYGYYPIHFLASYAICEFNPPKIDDIIQLLKDFKNENVDLNTLTKKGNNALHIALRLQKPALFIKELLLSGVSVSHMNKYGKTPYEYFKNYRFGDKEKLKSLFQTYYEKEKLEKEVLNDAIFIKEKKVKKI